MTMTVAQALEHFNSLQEQGYSDKEVFLDTGPHGLHGIGEIGLNDDDNDVIIWRE